MRHEEAVSISEVKVKQREGGADYEREECEERDIGCEQAVWSEELPWEAEEEGAVGSGASGRDRSNRHKRIQKGRTPLRFASR